MLDSVLSQRTADELDHNHMLIRSFPLTDREKKRIQRKVENMVRMGTRSQVFGYEWSYWTALSTLNRDEQDFYRSIWIPAFKEAEQRLAGYTLHPRTLLV